MTHFLSSDENPDGHRLEDVLRMIRKDILIRCQKVIDDDSEVASQVVNNNMAILNLISDAILLAEDSTQVLNKAFGPSKPGDPPRIGTE